MQSQVLTNVYFIYGTRDPIFELSPKKNLKKQSQNQNYRA
jgi:hypothetical protein